MRWLQLEYVFKGIYLGLLLFVALQEPSWAHVGLVALCTLGGLGLCLAGGAFGLALLIIAAYQLRRRLRDHHDRRHDWD